MALLQQDERASDSLQALEGCTEDLWLSAGLLVLKPTLLPVGGGSREMREAS